MKAKLPSLIAIGLLAAACHAASTAANTTPLATTAPPPSSSGYHPVIDPANFTAVVDNPWFPLKPGSKWVYEGVRDAEHVRDVTIVTDGIQKVDGVACVAVKDQLFHSDGSLVEDTTDFYTQDRQGNVWYFGEVTVGLDDHGDLTDTEGSWLSGEDGAEPGIFMEANPTVGHSFRQEFYPGHAEDQFMVLDLAASVSTPFRSFAGTLLTQETTVLEPSVVDHKNYAKGIGEVAELQVQGPQPPEELKLVSFTSG